MFGVFGNFTDPTVVTRRLGRVPTRSFGLGEFYTGMVDSRTQAARRRPVGVWLLYAVAAHSGDSICAVTAQLLQLISTTGDEVVRLQQGGYRTGVWLHAARRGSYVGEGLSAHQLARLAELGGILAFEADRIE
jgi:hypothetical protein